MSWEAGLKAIIVYDMFNERMSREDDGRGKVWHVIMSEFGGSEVVWVRTKRCEGDSDLCDIGAIDECIANETKWVDVCWMSVGVEWWCGVVEMRRNGSVVGCDKIINGAER
jgi:hypothetical protein